MKIIFAIKTLNGAKGGAERVLADVASGLAARGHDIVVMTFDHEGAGEPFYSLHPAIRECRLGIGNVGERATFLETIARIAAIRRAIHHEAPDIVAAFMHSMFVPLSFALIGTGVPVIGSEHIVPAHYDTRRFEFFLFWLSSFLIKKITVLSAAIKRSYPSFLHPKMLVMPNPVAQAQVKADAVAAGVEIKTILNVGRLDPQKDQETLIRAFALLHKNYPEWRVKILGEGDLKQRLSDLIVELGLQDFVFLLPPTRQIGDFYGAAQIFALPSLYESFGLATAEAMSHGVPPIGFADCPGTRELIENEKTGLLVEGQDRVSVFAEGLKRLMDNPAERRTLGENAKDYVRRFSASSVIDLWEGVLREFKRPDARIS